MIAAFVAGFLCGVIATLVRGHGDGERVSASWLDEHVRGRDV